MPIPAENHAPWPGPYGRPERPDPDPGKIGSETLKYLLLCGQVCPVVGNFGKFLRARLSENRIVGLGRRFGRIPG